MFFPAEAEKASEEKEKTPTATEVTDAKDKAEVADVKKGTSHCLWCDAAKYLHFFTKQYLCYFFFLTEEVKGEKDAGKEVKVAKEEAPKGNGKPPTERPRFMFNIADGGFTGQYWFTCRKQVQLIFVVLYAM